MIILDTNVVSELMQPQSADRVRQWLDRQPRDSIWITSVTVMEIRFGLSILAGVKRRRNLSDGFDATLKLIERRIAAFDDVAAEHAADLAAFRRIHGRPVDNRDTMIAGIAMAHHAALATRNVKHFADVPTQIVNPWTD